jgi:hypothetical protein
MSKKKRRKQRPEPPKYFWLDTDDCWFCKNRNRCSGCKILKRYVIEHSQSKRKRERDEKRFFDFS